VDAGSSQTFALTPVTGYQVQDVQLNGVSVGPLATVPLNGVSGDTTINASFILSTDLNNFVAMPSFVSSQVPPNVMIMLSVETPMGGVGNPNVTCGSGNPASLTASCATVTDSCSGTNGALGCYNDANDYVGYFDSHKCYTYSGSGTSGLFTAAAAATVQASTTNPAHVCSSKWSGNFLNWSTTMALDNFRKAFTGGNRDPSDSTIIVAGRYFPGQSGGWYPTDIKLDNSNLYTPYTGTRYFKRLDVGFGVCNSGQTDCSFGSSSTSGDVTAPVASTNMQAAFTLRIRACDTAYGVEGRCNASYTVPIPEGTIQHYATQMRFGLISYLKDDNQNRDGGVLRSNIKWLNPTIQYGTKYHQWNSGTSHYDVITCNTVGGCANPEAELDVNGNFIANPDGAPGTLRSGVINYINKFGYANGYKSYDPVSEMFYQGVRYFADLGPSKANNYCNGEVNPSTTDTANDGFAVFCDTATTPSKFSWRDYNIYPCAQNFLIGIQDANPWLDKRIPGSAFKGNYGGSAAGGTDWCGSTQGACDTDFSIGGTAVDVKGMTTKAGDNEGITGSTLSLACEVDDTGACMGGMSGGKNVVVQQLGRVIHSSREDSYNIVGLAYFAHTTNLRPDLTGSHTLTTYLIDTQEPSGGMTNGPRNELYLAAKYGGFEDKDGSGKPYNSLTIAKDGSGNITSVTNACGTSSAPALCSEWDSNGDGYPDTYFFASQSSAVQAGLDAAFKDMLRRMSSGTAASILSNSNGTGANLVQAVFYPEKVFDAQTQVDWIGEMQDFWYYVDPFLNNSTIREDTDGDDHLNLIKDNLVHFRFDGVQTWVDLSKDVKGDGSQTSFLTTVTPDNVKSLWKAGQLLWSRNLTSSPRTIYTSLDGATITNFLTLSPGTTNVQKMFQAGSSTEVTNLINFTHGIWNAGQASYRDRRVTQGTTSNVWKLGDIVSSTPKLLSSMPLNSYHLDPPGGYSDASYLAFTGTAAYKARGMAFVGANDGMLHAFNLGVLTPISSPYDKASMSTSGTFGMEQWAYIPRNVIPYLRYYADPKYNHIFSVDGPTVVNDLSLTNPPACSEANYWNCTRAVESWKTVLLGSMGVGGSSAMNGASCIDCVRTPILDPVDTTKGLGYSTYFALDVSTPTTPSLLWEFSNPLLGYATTGPAIVRINPLNAGSTKNGRWIAVFASGPTGGIDSTVHQFKGRSNQNLRIFVVDLKTGALLSKGSDGNPGGIDTGIPYAFAGTITSASIDTDRWNPSGGKGLYQDDVLYIGYTKRVGDGSNGNPYAWTGGGVLRVVIPENTDPDHLDPGTWAVSKVIDDIGAVTTSIVKLQDRKKHNLWLYFGTGRFYNSADDPSTQRKIFGVKDPCYKASATHTDGSTSLDDISDKDCTDSGTTNSLQFDLSDLDNKDAAGSTAVNNGWYINLAAASSTANAERVVTDPVALTNGVVYFTTFAPTTDICLFGGSTALWAVTYDTGGTPSGAALGGKALLQTSTGGFQEIALSNAFTLNYNRKTGGNITGKPPSDPPPIISNSNLKPIKKILHIMER
jgi:Tfp pilus tip-associated adhesin PilY1